MNFIDSNHFVIINNTPYYKYLTNSYRDKLKNGLSFDYVFSMEDNYNKLKSSNDDNNNNNHDNHPNYVIKPILRNNYCSYNIYEFHYLFPSKKRGKINNINKSSKRKSKKQKKKIQKNGYYDKIWNREQQLQDNITFCANKCQLIQRIQINNNNNNNSSSIQYIYLNWLFCLDNNITGFIPNSFYKQYINIYIKPNDFDQLENIEKDFLVNYFKNHKVSYQTHILWNIDYLNVYFYINIIFYQQKKIEYITIKLKDYTYEDDGYYNDANDDYDGYDRHDFRPE